MKKDNRHIEITVSTNKGMHSMAPRTAQAIKEVLENHYETVGISILNDLGDLKGLVLKKPDLVFNGMKRLPDGNGGNVMISSYLEKNGIAVTGSDAEAVELERDKTKAKDVIDAAGLATSKYKLVNTNQQYDKTTIPMKFPLFIKPSGRGAGLGINENSVVRNFKELNTGIQSLEDAKYTDIMVENYFSGREFSVVMLKKEGETNYHAMPLELIAPLNKKGDRVLGSGVKHADIEKSVVVEAGELKDELAAFAQKAFTALGARDYGRIDIRLDDNDEPQFLEANLLPSLVDGFGNFPKACLLDKGLEYDAVILRIASLAFARAA